MDNPSQHPIVILKDVTFADLRTMVDFMYYGEVNVTEEQLTQVSAHLMAWVCGLVVVYYCSLWVDTHMIDYETDNDNWQYMEFYKYGYYFC